MYLDCGESDLLNNEFLLPSSDLKEDLQSNSKCVADSVGLNTVCQTKSYDQVTTKIQDCTQLQLFVYIYKNLGEQIAVK